MRVSATTNPTWKAQVGKIHECFRCIFGNDCPQTSSWLRWSRLCLVAGVCPAFTRLGTLFWCVLSSQLLPDLGSGSAHTDSYPMLAFGRFFSSLCCLSWQWLQAYIRFSGDAAQLKVQERTDALKIKPSASIIDFTWSLLAAGQCACVCECLSEKACVCVVCFSFSVSPQSPLLHRSGAKALSGW